MRIVKRLIELAEDGGVKKTAYRVWQASNGFVSERSSPNFPVFKTDVLFVNITTGVSKTRVRDRGRIHPNFNPHPKTALFKKDRSLARPRVFLTPDYDKDVCYSPATFVTPERFPFSSILPSCYVSSLMPDVGKQERRDHNGLWIMFWFFYFLNCSCRNCRITK